MVFHIFFYLRLNFAIRWPGSGPQSAPGIVFTNCIEHLHLWLQKYNQSDFSIDHLLMSMYRGVSWVVGKGCLLWPVYSLKKTILAFALLHFVLQGQTWYYFGVSLASYFCILIPNDEKDIFFGVSSRRCCRSSHNRSTSRFSASVKNQWLGHGLWCWMVCLGNELRLFCFWGCTHVLPLGFFCWLSGILHFF